MKASFLKFPVIAPNLRNVPEKKNIFSEQMKWIIVVFWTQTASFRQTQCWSFGTEAPLLFNIIKIHLANGLNTGGGASGFVSSLLIVFFYHVHGGGGRIGGQGEWSDADRHAVYLEASASPTGLSCCGQPL